MENKKPQIKWIDIFWLVVILLSMVLAIGILQLGGYFFYGIIFLSFIIVVGLNFSPYARKRIPLILPISIGIMLLVIGISVVRIITIPDIDHDFRVGTYKINTHYSDFGPYDSSLYNNLTLELTDTRYKFTPCPPFLSNCEGEWKVWPESVRGEGIYGRCYLDMNGEEVEIFGIQPCSFVKPPPPKPGKPQINALEFTMIEGGYVEYLKRNKANLERNNK